MAKSSNSTYPTDLTGEDITVTESARQMFGSLMDDADPEFESIRMYVQGGGCGGMEYSMTFSEDATERDCVFDGGSFKLIIDPVAYNFLQGCEIDYVDEGISSSFVFRNAFQSVGGSGKCSGCGGGGF